MAVVIGNSVRQSALEANQIILVLRVSKREEKEMIKVILRYRVSVRPWRQEQFGAHSHPTVSPLAVFTCS